MELNKNSWLAKYVDWVYGYLPDDLCTFFHCSWIAIVLAPFFIPAAIREQFVEVKWPNDFWNKIGVFGITMGIVIMYHIVGFGLIRDTVYFADNMPYWMFLLNATIGILLLTICTAAILGAIAAVFFIFKWMFSKDRIVNDVIIAKIQATKDNYCPLITWKK